MRPVQLSVCSLVLLVACTANLSTLSGDEAVAKRHHHAQADARDGGAVIYVADWGAPDGDGATPDTPFASVKQAVDAACTMGGRPTISVAPGEYTEHQVVVSCPMRILGEQNPLVYGPNGRPSGIADEGVARITTDPPLWSDGDDTIWDLGDARTWGLFPDRPALFVVASSDVEIAQLALDGGITGYAQWWMPQIIDVEGGTGANDGSDPRCPAGGELDGVVIRDVALTRGGIALFTHYANVIVSHLYSHGNGIGAGFSAGVDTHAALLQSTITGNNLYGVGAYGSPLEFFPRCALDTQSTQPTRLVFDLLDSEISYNGGGGIRNSPFMWGNMQNQPVVPATLVTNAWFDSFVGNGSYGFWGDFLPWNLYIYENSWPAVQPPSQFSATLLLDDFQDNGRNDAYFGFTHNGLSQLPEEWIADWIANDPGGEDIYMRGASIDVQAWPQPAFDYDNPSPYCFVAGEWPTCEGGLSYDAGDVLTVNGETYTGRYLASQSE